MMVSTTTSARRGVTPAVRALARTEVVWSPAGQDGGRAAGVPGADSTTPIPRSGLATGATPATTTGTTPRRPARCPRRPAPRCSARAVTAPRNPPAGHGPGRAVAQPQGATPSRAATITVSRNLVSVGRSRVLAGAHPRRPRRMTSAPNRARPPLTSAVRARRPGPDQDADEDTGRGGRRRVTGRIQRPRLRRDKSDFDNDPWPSYDEDDSAVPDEKYWSDIYSDRPLSTTARPAHAAADADQGWGEPAAEAAPPQADPDAHQGRGRRRRRQDDALEAGTEPRPAAPPAPGPGPSAGGGQARGAASVAAGRGPADQRILLPARAGRPPTAGPIGARGPRATRTSRRPAAGRTRPGPTPSPCGRTRVGYGPDPLSGPSPLSRPASSQWPGGTRQRRRCTKRRPAGRPRWARQRLSQRSGRRLPRWPGAPAATPVARATASHRPDAVTPTPTTATATAPGQRTVTATARARTPTGTATGPVPAAATPTAAEVTRRPAAAAAARRGQVRAARLGLPHRARATRRPTAIRPPAVTPRPTAARPRRADGPVAGHHAGPGPRCRAQARVPGRVPHRAQHPIPVAGQLARTALPARSLPAAPTLPAARTGPAARTDGPATAPTRATPTRGRRPAGPGIRPGRPTRGAATPDDTGPPGPTAGAGWPG